MKNLKDLEAVHAFLNNQGVKSMADAYKGVNEANRIVDVNGNSINGHAILFDGNNPVVSSTSSNTKATLVDPYTNNYKDALAVAFGFAPDTADPTKTITTIK